jgi:hypothetical protein
MLEMLCTAVHMAGSAQLPFAVTGAVHTLTLQPNTLNKPGNDETGAIVITASMADNRVLHQI